MRNWVLFLLLLLSACSHVSTRAPSVDKISLITKENVAQGYYEEFYFDGKKHKGVELYFDIEKYNEGKWLPMVGIGLTDQSLQRKFAVKLSPQSGRFVVDFEIYDGQEEWFAESISFNKRPDVMMMSWKDRQVTVTVLDRDVVLEMPFEIAFIRNTSSSIAVTKRFVLIGNEN